jgi:small subunit ribosomal protein S6
MNLYEHTIVARQDVTSSQIKELTEKYLKIVKKNEGEILQTQNWGLLNLSCIIKKNKKGNYIHFKFKGPTKIISDLEENESMDKNLLRYLTVKVKKFDLETNYFDIKDDNEKKKSENQNKEKN